jgi:hypothetical protein
VPKKVSPFAKKEQPIHWGRTFLVGALSAVAMMAFIDIFYLMGITPFAFEDYVGSLIRATPYGPHNWTVGFLANCVMGGVFAIFYAYLFEYVYYGTSSRLGVWIGFLHSILAAVAIFPFFNTVHEVLGTGLYPHFGLLGSGLGGATAILIFAGHLLFGVCMGTFYGPARSDRVQGRYFEPGETVAYGEEGAITFEDAPEDRIAV